MPSSKARETGSDLGPNRLWRWALVLAVAIPVAIVVTSLVTRELILRNRPLPQPGAETVAGSPAVQDSPEQGQPRRAAPAPTKPPASQPARPSPETLSTRQMAEVLDHLTQAQENRLARAVFNLQTRRRRAVTRPIVEADRRLFAVLGSREDVLALADAQRRQLEALRESFRPRIEAALADNWKRQDAVWSRIDDFWWSHDEYQPDPEGSNLARELQVLFAEEQELKRPMDVAFEETAARKVLTPAQVEYLEWWKADMERRTVRHGP